MRVVCLYRDDTDYAREVTDWMYDFKKETGREVEVMDPDSIDGEIFTKAHDILQFPMIVAVTNDGVVQKKWGGTPLPQFDEVVYYLREM
ncbi:hypothetical protein IJG66_00655 [Candidatus Saccharibacteria bacterium]|nr:hypothetical protein [Candidatus Saccharibacteria bacterium]